MKESGGLRHVTSNPCRLSCWSADLPCHVARAQSLPHFSWASGSAVSCPDRHMHVSRHRMRPGATSEEQVERGLARVLSCSSLFTPRLNKLYIVCGWMGHSPCHSIWFSTEGSLQTVAPGQERVTAVRFLLSPWKARFCQAVFISTVTSVPAEHSLGGFPTFYVNAFLFDGQ